MDLVRTARTFIALALMALVAPSSGCAQFSVPQIDPTGKRIFVWSVPTTTEPGLAIPSNSQFLQLAPKSIVAPVGGEVVMVATAIGPDLAPHADQVVEWSLAPGGIGQFIGMGDPTNVNCDRGLLSRGADKKSQTYLITHTYSINSVLTRGTETPADDITIGKGQAWVSVSSPVEGTSYVTAYSPKVYGWDQHQQQSTIQWVDLRWTPPPPAVNPVGTRHPMTTTVTRATTGAPVAGYRVRYEVTSGPAAGFAPDGGRAIEVPTNELGQATVELYQTAPAPGVNQINVQVIRPSGLIQGSDRMVIGSTTTTKTWTAPQVALQISGPPAAAIGGSAAYRISVSNTGNTSANDVVVTLPLLQGFTHVRSTPAAQVQGTELTWRLGSVSSQPQIIEVELQPTTAGTFNVCSSLRSAEGLTAQSCASTTVRAAKVEIRLNGPPTATVGTDTTFDLEVINRSESVISGLVLTDTFDAGFQHAASASPIQRDLDPMQPNETRKIPLQFRVTQPGRLCHTVLLTGNGGLRETAQACLQATAMAAPAPVPVPVPAPIPSPSATTPPATPAPGSVAGGTLATLDIKGPKTIEVGKTAEFVIEVVNTGTTPIKNMTITATVERPLEPRQASEGGQAKADGKIVWSIPGTIQELAPQGKLILQVNCVGTSAGQANARVDLESADLVLHSEAPIVIGGAAATAPTPTAGRVSLKVVDLNDPVRVGGTIRYQVLVTNDGTTPVQQAVVALTLSDQTASPRIIRAPTRSTVDGSVVRFDTVQELRPNESLTFEIEVQANRAGAAQIKAELTSPSLAAPAVAGETTQITQ